MELDLQYSTPSLRSDLEKVLPTLETLGCTLLVVGSTRRPGEPEYLFALVHLPGRRHGFGTPELRGLPLREQEHDFLQQLRAAVAGGLAPQHADLW